MEAGGARGRDSRRSIAIDNGESKPGNLPPKRARLMSLRNAPPLRIERAWHPVLAPVPQLRHRVSVPLIFSLSLLFFYWESSREGHNQSTLGHPLFLRMFFHNFRLCYFLIFRDFQIFFRHFIACCFDLPHKTIPRTAVLYFLFTRGTTSSSSSSVEPAHSPQLSTTPEHQTHFP